MRNRDLVCLSLLLLLFHCACVAQQPADSVSATAQQFGDVPLAFEPNQGQANPDVRFVSRAQALTVLLKDDEATLIAPADSHYHTPAMVHMKFVGASRQHQPVALQKQEGVSNYLLGDSPAEWRSGIPNFGRIRYPGIYPGVDLDLYGNHRRLEHDFIVAPGANYRQILVRLEGATNLSLSENGNLQVATANGKLTFKTPEIYQYRGSKKVLVDGRYLVAASNEFRFSLGAYDHDLPLVIDPVLAYSTYLAGSASEYAGAIAVDKSGNAYVTGLTFSIDFPVKNAIQGTCANICQNGDVFVTKLNPSGTALVYSTFVGGNQQERPSAIAVDGSGFAAVAGSTGSLDFPQKNGTAVVLSSFNTHGFAFELNPAGSAFSFSTYLGGENSDTATGVATDSLGNVYITGYTSSAFFRFTPTNQIGPAPTNGSDLFVVKVARNGKLGYSTLIGGASVNYPGTFTYQANPISIAVDSAGEAVLSGSALDGFPTTPGSYQPDFQPASGPLKGFLAKLDSTGSSILYGTYLGGTGGDTVNGLALDTLGNAYVTGYTSSRDFPTTNGAFQTTFTEAAYYVGFVSKLDPTLSTLTYSTYLEATQTDFGTTFAAGIAVNATGSSYIIGTTSQPSFPLVSPIIATLPQTYYGNGTSAFLSVLNSSGSALTLSTLFTGSTGTSGSGVALNPAGDAFITGTTLDQDLPTTATAFQPSSPASPYSQHVFATKFSMSKANPGACFSSSSLNFGTVKPGDSSYPLPLTITNCGTLSLKISSVTVTNPFFVVTQNTCKTVAAGASCSITVRYTPTAADGSDIGSLQIKDNAPIPLQNVPLTGYSALPSIQIYTGDIVFPDNIVGLTSAPVYVQIQTYGLLPLHVTSVSASGDFAATNLCPAELYQGNGCLISVTFSPTSTGTRTGTLSIFDDAPGSPQTLNLTGTGVTSYPVPAISYLSPSSALVGSPAVSVSVSGDHIFSTTKATINGKSVVSKYDNTFGLSLTVPATVMTSLADLSIQLVNPTPGGGSSAPAHFTVYKQVKLGAADLVYEPFTQRLYASIPARAPSSPNTFVTVDPTTGLLGAHVPVGNDPSAMGISSDGTALYVALNGSNSIVPVNVGTRTPGVEIPLGSDPQKGPLSASRIQVQPGQPNSFVATLTAGFNGSDGIDWFKNGNLVTQFLNEPPTNVVMNDPIFVGPNDVYGWGGSFGGTGFAHFVLTANSMLEAPGLPESFGLGPFDTDGKNLFLISGQVYSASTGALLGTLGGETNFSSSAVLTDASSGRTFLLSQFPGIFGFDSTTFAQVGTTGAINAYSASNRLLHWGTDGLAFLTTDYSTNTGDLILLRSNLFYPAPGPNPPPVATSLSPASVTSKAPNFVLTVNGSHFVRGAVVLWNGATRTTKWVSASKLTADIPGADIKAKGTAQVTVSNPAPGGGTSSALTITIN